MRRIEYIAQEEAAVRRCRKWVGASLFNAAIMGFVGHVSEWLFMLSLWASMALGVILFIEFALTFVPLESHFDDEL